MRYFYISFSHNAGFGAITLELETFPRHSELITSILSANNQVDEITILNIFEFKNKDDYDQFNGTTS
jgi:hypothetical protein